MDYGYFYGSTPNNTVAANTVKRSQVFQATHDRAGDRLPSYRRSFISFTYGGKHIEDFELIACCESNTLSRGGYAEFEDLVTSYDIMDGQYYHGTHFKPNTLSLRLVTESMDEKKLNEFLHWFQGGRTRELILAEHPNRAIMARVSAPPQLELTAFEKKIKVRVGAAYYDTSTTVYKGFITLDLVADTPFWYAKQNILFKNADSEDTFQGLSIFSSDDHMKEALKVMYEDTVPSSELVMATMHFGTTQYALVGDEQPYSVIMVAINEQDPYTQPNNWAELENQLGYFKYEVEDQGAGTFMYVKGARISDNTQILGRIAGPTIGIEGADQTGSLSSANAYDFFYGGTAPSPTLLSFGVRLKPESVEVSTFIDTIANTYAPKDGKQYSSITVQSMHTKRFDFTTPNVVSSWNKAKQVLNNIIPGATSWGDLADTLRDQIRHPAVRAWAVQSIGYAMGVENIDYINDKSGVISTEGKDRLREILNNFFVIPEDVNGNWSTASFTFDSDLCLAQGTFRYWRAANSSINIVSTALNRITNHIADPDNFVTVTENVGDMLRSNWLFLEDHNEFTEEGLVRAWSNIAPQNAHKLTHNAPVPLNNLKLEYKNMYL